MNILVPDSWLRRHLKTSATPKQIKEYLSLCGPSVERINEVGKEIVYDIEITTNRPDSMSVAGVAREASVILPRFGVEATFLEDPYEINLEKEISKYSKLSPMKIKIKTNSSLNPRWSSVIIDDVAVGPSPVWMQKLLELTGIRPINNIVDVTNFIMRDLGQPVHAFDADEILKNSMTLRESKKGESVVTLDGQKRKLENGDIIIEDGSGRIIDLCGIMGGENSAIKKETKSVMLFMQTYDPTHIRQTSMRLGLRTEAATLFEKGPDSELVMPALLYGINLICENSKGKVASRIFDTYENKYVSKSVAVSKTKLFSFLGQSLDDETISKSLVSLGFQTKINQHSVEVKVPSFRRDVEVDVDVIEEVARIFGYHNIKSELPSTPPPVTFPDPTLYWENEIKVRLRDLGFFETYSNSMISKEQLSFLDIDEAKTYRISNPLSSEWEFMRPNLVPSVLEVIKNNLNDKNKIRVFELSMVYEFRKNDLPVQRPNLVIAWNGENLRIAKGVAQYIFKTMNIPHPVESYDSKDSMIEDGMNVSFGKFGNLGTIKKELLKKIGIKGEVTVLNLDFSELVAQATTKKTYVTIPKYPPTVESFSFALREIDNITTEIIKTIKSVDSLIENVTLIDSFENNRTFEVSFSSPDRTLTTEDIVPLREKINSVVKEKFSAEPRTT